MSAGRDIWAVVPVKQRATAKSRLAPRLAGDVRARLAIAMFEDVLDALTRARGLAGIVVVTVDPVAARIGALHGATVIDERATEGHTVAVTSAARRLHDERRGGMLAVPGDIPALRAAEIETLLDRHRAAPAFTIAPAHDGRGSNAVVLSPPTAVPLAFGNDSFAPHVAAARRAGIEPTIVRGLEGVARDVDCYEDLVAVLRIEGVAARTRSLCAEVRPARTDVGHASTVPGAESV